jgi:ssDNA-binding Zn-finger/Zn-ribbon topoisomerase 1
MSELQEGNSGNDFELAVPVAHTSEGETVHPGEAMREEDHYCPACEEELIYRAGEVMRPHFAHHGGNPCSSPETILHHAAKRRLAKTIRRWIEGKRTAPRFARECRLCKKPEVEQKIPDSITEVRLEHTLQNGYRPDVLLLAGEGTPQPAAAIEVFVTHEVGEQKGKNLNLPWIEVTAESVMEGMDEQKTGCLEVERDGLGKPVCTDCGERLVDLRRKIEGLLNRWNVDWPKGGYRIGVQDCWNCGVTIPVFEWGAGMHSTEEPPDPRPRTIQYRYSNTVGSKYWANTCPKCNQIQGDWPLRKKREGAFGPTYDSEKLLLRRAQEEGLLS